MLLIMQPDEATDEVLDVQVGAAESRADGEHVRVAVGPTGTEREDLEATPGLPDRQKRVNAVYRWACGQRATHVCW